MSDWPQAWLQAAERSVPGPEFNLASFALRGEVEASLGQASVYEVQLDPSEAEPAFAARVKSQLQDHLLSKRMSPRGSASLLVWLWFEADAYLFRGAAFVARLEAVLDAQPKPMLPPPPESI